MLNNFWLNKDRNLKFSAFTHLVLLYRKIQKYLDTMIVSLQVMLANQITVIEDLANGRYLIKILNIKINILIHYLCGHSIQLYCESFLQCFTHLWYVLDTHHMSVSNCQLNKEVITPEPKTDTAVSNQLESATLKYPALNALYITQHYPVLKQWRCGLAGNVDGCVNEIGGIVVRASDLWSTGCEFNSQQCTAGLVKWVTVSVGN